MSRKYSDSESEIKSQYSLFNICLLILFTMVPVMFFALDYKPLPVVVIAGLFLFVFISYLIIEITGRVELIFAFLILLFSFHGFSSFPGSNFTEINNYGILAFLYVLLLVVFIFSRNQEYLRLNLSSRDKSLLLLFLLFFTVSIFYNAKDLTEPLGLSKIILLCLSFPLMCGYIPGLLIENKKTLNIFLKSLVYFGILSGIFGFITMIYPEINRFNLYPGTAISFFKHPNATATIYNFTVPATLYFLFFKRKEISVMEKSIYMFGLLLMFFNVLFTLSRTGIFSMCLIFLIMSYSYSKKLFFTSLLLAPILLIFALFGFFTSKGASTAIGRVGLLATTIEMFNSSGAAKLLGHGSYSTIKIFEKIKISLNVADENNVPHNVLVYFVLQFGLLTAVPFFLFIFKSMFRALLKLSKSVNKNLLSVSVAVCFSVFFKNMGEDLMFFPEFILFHLFLIFFGFILIIINNNALKIDSVEIAN